MKLILSNELGRLSKWLRILGFDAQYFRQNNPASLVIAALGNDRIIITRDHKLAKPRGIKVVFIESEHLKDQLKQVFKALNVSPEPDKLFTRCIICNEPLTRADKEKVQGDVPEFVFKTQENFLTCPICRRVYWQGTHWGNVAKILEEIS